MDLFQEFKALIGTLRESEIEYALCGGFALSVYGIVRATEDVVILDVLHVTPAVEEFWVTGVEVETDLGRIAVVSRKGLIGLKQLRGSPVDLSDIASLEDSDTKQICRKERKMTKEVLWLEADALAP